MRRVIEPEPCNAHTLYLRLDGTGVPVRAGERDGRKGRQPDASAKTREAKLLTVGSCDTLDPRALPVRGPHSTTCNAAIDTAATRDTDPNPSPFAHRVLRETKRQRFHEAERQVILGDAAAWIWNLADEHFPDTVQIVDIFHAKGHLFEVAKALYGPGTDLAAQWGKQRRDELDQGRINALLALPCAILSNRFDDFWERRALAA